MKQMCKKKYPSPRYTVTNFLTPAEPRLQTTVRQFGLSDMHGRYGY